MTDRWTKSGRQESLSGWERAEKRLLAVDGQGQGLAVALWRQNDRYAHALYAFPGGADFAELNRAAGELNSSVLLMASQEGTDREAWPVSPPLQQLIVEPRESGREVALLIGMAGSSHWSLSIDVDPISRLIVFEAACRCSAQPSDLGSRYWLQPGNRSSARALRWNFPASAGVELLWPESRGHVSEPETGKPQWMVRPSEMPTDKWPATVRWSYAVRWLGEASGEPRP